MSWWEALLLGVVQGATEFLPVSSSGHLVISQVALGIDVRGIAFEVAVHVATLVSVLWVYRRRVGRLVLGGARGEGDAVGYLGLLLLASVPAGLVGVFFRDAMTSLFDRPAVTGFALLVTGAVLWSSRWASRGDTRVDGREGQPGVGRRPATAPDVPLALVVGTVQALAIVPGISRSGVTVVAALWLGLEAREAAAFSFLLSVPAIAGAAVLSAPELAAGAHGLGGAVLLGGVAAALAGVLAIRTFVAALERQAFHSFALYCWLVGVAFLGYLLVR